MVIFQWKYKKLLQIRISFKNYLTHNTSRFPFEPIFPSFPKKQNNSLCSVAQLPGATALALRFQRLKRWSRYSRLEIGR